MRVLALLTLTSLVCAGCRAADPREVARTAAVAPPPTLAEQVRDAARASAPGPMHRRLDTLAGDWRVELTDVAEDQTERPVAHGDARLEWVHDHRYLAWSARLAEAGTTTGFLGYDLRQEQYQLLMISSLSTGMGVATGYGDPAGQGVRFTLESFDPSHGQRARMSSLLRLLGPNHFVLDAYGVDAAGRERVVRRTHYRRISPAVPVANP